jgi:hypothetical protein
MAGKRAWRVTGQVSDQVINTQAGQTLTGTYVYFVTGKGNAGSVFVEDAVYSVEQVRRQVHEAANKLDDVGDLTFGQFD